MTRLTEDIASALDAHGLDATIDARTLAAVDLAATEFAEAASSGSDASLAAVLQTAPRPDDVGIDLVDVIGEGGMGVVHRGRQRSIGRDVAVKSLRATLADDPSHATALLREGLLTGRLEHPNIVPVHALNRGEDGSPRIVMKRIEGESWRTRLRAFERPLSDDEVLDELQIFVSVCRAIEFAHSRGTIHRDIKPENVMVGGYGEVYVVDWGIAVHGEPVEHGGTDPQTSAVSGVAGFVGTPAYMAPEMLEGDPSLVDARTDVYLLGATLYDALTGTAPHLGAEGLWALVNRIALLPACTLPEDTGVHDELAHIVARATACRPDDRYPDVASLRRAVSAYLRHHTSLALTDRADDARERFEQIIAGLDDDAAARRRAFEAFSEVQLGYRAALHDWPDNARAKTGLDEALERMCRYALATDQPELATSLVAQMTAPPSDLERELEQSRDKIARRREAGAELARREVEGSLSIAGSRFLGLLVSLLVIGGFVTTWFIWNAGSLRVSVENHQLVTLIVVFTAITSLGSFVFRDTLLRTEASRSLLLGLFVLLLVILAHRVLSLVAGTPAEAVIGRDLLLMSGVLITGGVVLGRWLAAGGFVTFVFAIPAIIWPPYAASCFGLAQIVLPVVVVPLFVRRIRADAARLREHGDD